MNPRIDPLADLVAMPLAQSNFDGSPGMLELVDDRRGQPASTTFCRSSLTPLVALPQFEQCGCGRGLGHYFQSFAHALFDKSLDLPDQVHRDSHCSGFTVPLRFPASADSFSALCHLASDDFVTESVYAANMTRVTDENQRNGRYHPPRPG